MNDPGAVPSDGWWVMPIEDDDDFGPVALPSNVNVRRTRDVRLIERGGAVVAYPEPHRTPVLPPGWAPLSREQQEAVLHACDSASEGLQFRVGSPWDPSSEYRVYQLQTDLWGGLAVAVGCGGEQSGPLLSRRLLGLGRDVPHAMRIVVDFLNWDLEAHGCSWRLALTGPSIDHS